MTILLKKNFISIFIFILVTLLTLVFLEFNTSYQLISKIPKIIHNQTGILFIGTHNYEHKDIFITFKQFEKINKKFYMLFANKKWNHWLEPFRPKNIEFIYVKEKTVECISSKLLLGENVIMFLYYESDSTGPFYIIKNTKCPLVLLKIKKENKQIKENKTNLTTEDNNLITNHYNSSFKEIYINNFMSNFNVKIKKFRYNLSKFTNSKNFINELKQNLYS
uniref:Uncharacterized protein n=1 Tax=viral metagenome TaxID=1070528 RepID=A0A6C0LGB6_9ZZZZ